MNEYYYNGGAGAVSGDGEFVVLGLPVFLRRLNASFDIILAYTRQVNSFFRGYIRDLDLDSSRQSPTGYHGASADGADSRTGSRVQVSSILGLQLPVFISQHVDSIFFLERNDLYLGRCGRCDVS